jgi:hypothetical protein
VEKSANVAGEPGKARPDQFQIPILGELLEKREQELLEQLLVFVLRLLVIQ